MAQPARCDNRANGAEWLTKGRAAVRSCPILVIVEATVTEVAAVVVGSLAGYLWWLEQRWSETGISDVEPVARG